MEGGAIMNAMHGRTKLVVANWKMNPATLSDARKLFRAVSRLSVPPHVSLILAVPSPYLAPLAARSSSKRITFAAQDVFPGTIGSHTGETSPAMLASVGAHASIVGHSERRSLGETNETVARKVRAALDAGLEVVLCVGETVRDAQGAYLTTLAEQLSSALAGIPRSHAGRTIIAYEPVWAIGKSAEAAMKPHDVHQMVVFVRKTLTPLLGPLAVRRVRVLYGGSVEGENAEAIVRDGEVDGLLVGHASLSVDSFRDIVGAAERAARRA